ncbi:SLAM family member 9-like isoform X2 [Bufo gargarizans]|uniref:SLAM family member 9-like isoform X2 n=1 Tax=Bufo gargarizans TaxID=30331 RepID=UPI001CF3AFD8|nr:SLAM family member 9-like isoform X2 [Bufo gargarizans]
MKMLLRLLLSMMIVHQPCVVCGLEHVSAAEGGEVILRVPRSENTVINWILLPSGTVVAITEPGNPIYEKALRNEYRGRVSSEDDGSLHIYHLSLKDQGVYRAQSLDERICVKFNLTVYENLSSGDIKINHNLTRNDTCSLSLLCAVDKRDVTITWSNAQSGDINVTGGVLYVPPRDVNFTYTCTARNPVSNVSKTVIPGEYCRRGDSNSNNSSMLGQRLFHGLTPATIIIIIIIVAAVFCIWCKKRKSQKAEMTRTEMTTTEYAKVEGLQNPYYESQGENQGSASVYSEVQHAKKTTNSPKKLAENKAKTGETVYSEVSLPKQTKNSQKKLAEKEANPVETVYSTVSLPKA